jgi:hypothetical protein
LRTLELILEFEKLLLSKPFLLTEEHMDSKESSSTRSISLAEALGVFLLLIWRSLEDILRIELSLSEDPIEEGINLRVGTKFLPFFYKLVCSSF